MTRFALALLLVILPAIASQSEDAAQPKEIRAAIQRSLPLLQRGAVTFRERSEGRCISCHHQGLILPTIALARERGFAVNEPLAREEIERVHGFYVRRQARYAAALDEPAGGGEADAFGNFTVHAGYWLWALSAEKIPGDKSLETTALLLAAKQWDDGRFSFTDTARAPIQAGDFTTTALAVFALQHYGPAPRAKRTAQQIAQARQWLIATAPRTTDDQAFRLYGLAWSGAPAADVQQAASALIEVQRGDGGFGQQPNMPSDAYATGLVLAALWQAGKIPATDARMHSGIEYLVRTQQADGSWLVKTRAIPTNPYFESGFPHGRSQFISYAGTCWATMALCLALAP